MTADKLEVKIMAELRRLERKGNRIPDTYTAWTEAILTGLARLGKSLGYRVYTSKGNPKGDIDAGEWIYDLVWLSYNRDGYIQKMPLALESELSPNKKDLLDDFCKLLVARADHRVMIFSANNKAGAEKKIFELIDELEHCGLTCFGDRYLFAGLLENDGTFLTKLHKVRTHDLTTPSDRLAKSHF
jgi:hypothetical protein